MNKINFIILLIVSNLFCLCSDGLFSGDEEMEGLTVAAGAAWPLVPDACEYPAGPFGSHDEYVAARQIPSDILNDMSTLGVIYSYVNLPGLPEEILVSSAGGVEPFYRTYERFNSGKEILRRREAGKALLAFYKSINWNCASAIQGFSIRMRAFECFFTKEEILRQFNLQGKKNIARLILSNYKREQSHWEAGMLSVHPVLTLIMYHSNYSPLVDYCKNNGIDIQDTTFLIETHRENAIITLAESFIR
jgi:hypothetical protein